MSKRITRLLEKKLNGDKIIAFDVGAKGGVFAFPKLLKHINFYGFEPNPEEFNSLKSENNNITYFPFALAEEKEYRDINITKHSSYSSLLKFNWAQP